MIVASPQTIPDKASTISMFLSMMFFLTACDDGPANDAPTVVATNTYALCALRDGSDALSEINFVIEDLQGSDTLLQPYVAYRNVSIPVIENSIPAPSSEEIAAAKAEGQKLSSCSVDSCQMQYSWTYDRNDDQGALLRCDENSQIDVIIKDINNNEKIFKIYVMNEE